MKHIVQIEVEAITKGQALAIVQGVIENSISYNNIQGWTHASVKVVDAKEVTNA